MHFEIAAKEPEKLQKFYESTFGWKFTKIKAPIEYWTIKTGDGEPGTDGGMMKKMPIMGPHNIIGVPSVDQYVDLVKKNGGSIAIPKLKVAGLGKVAIIRDPEGNEFGILEPEPAGQQ